MRDAAKAESLVVEAIQNWNLRTFTRRFGPSRRNRSFGSGATGGQERFAGRVLFPDAVEIIDEDFFVISVYRKLNGVPTIDYHAGAIFLLDCLRELGGFSSNI